MPAKEFTGFLTDLTEIFGVLTNEQYEMSIV
jgi:hypothetical protein